MMKRLIVTCAAALTLALGISAASGDACGSQGLDKGSILSGPAGNAVASDMDCGDRPYAARAFRDSFQGPVGRRHAWRNGPNRGYIVSDREYREGRLICRDYTQVIYRHGREFDRQGAACRARLGNEWQFNN